MENSFRDSALIIPYKKLSQGALDGVLENYILREGTDYGYKEYSLAEKKEHVLHKLEKDLAVVIFDIEADSCTIALTEES